MDAGDDPLRDLDPDLLGSLCAQRAEALQARAWRDEAERDALREATAHLLRAVACRLGARVPLCEAALTGEALRDYLANHLDHQPLARPRPARRGAPTRDGDRGRNADC